MGKFFLIMFLIFVGGQAFAGTIASSPDASSEKEIMSNIKKALTSKNEETNSILYKTIEKFPQNPLAYLILSNELVARAIEEETKGNIESAIKFSQEAGSLMVKYLEIIENLSEPLQKENQIASPAEVKQREIWKTLAKKTKKRIEENKEWEDRLIKEKECRDIHRKGDQLIEERKYLEAIDQYNIAINNDKTFKHCVYFRRGVAYQSLKEYDKALSDLDKAIEISSKDPVFLSRRGWIYRDKGEYQKALVDYSAAIKLDNKYEYAYVGRSKTYDLLGNKKAAKKDHDRAKELRAFK